tara:strand:- start:1468 stop:2220 length:753 start_codon:yes stop_codon:yes gene_type:complete
MSTLTRSTLSYQPNEKQKSMSYESIDSNLIQVRRDIDALKRKYRRTKEEVALIAVSKGQSSAYIRRAYTLGIQKFGENYLQEAKDKQSELGDLEIEWHFIGAIQSNKTSYIANNFSWIHSLERLKIARRLNEQRGKDMPQLNVLIQINLPGETKSGIQPGELSEFSKEIMNLENLRLRGVMYFPPKTDTFDESLAKYLKVINLTKSIKSMDTLSMGTSSDYEAAIAAGTTMIRLGTTIFGPKVQGHGVNL